MTIERVLNNLQPWHIEQGDVLDVLRKMPDDSIHCVVTSPPYWGLRDYGIEPTIWGGDPCCSHEWNMQTVPTEAGRGNWSQAVNGRGEAQGPPEEFREPARSISLRGACSKCSAWRGCLGLEPTPEMYVDHIVEIFREVRRVLRPDGTCWINLGDSYVNDHKYGGASGGKHRKGLHGTQIGRDKRFTGLKEKDLVGIPWRVAFALQSDGWYLRRDIIWEKPTAMPESVRDRPTTSHEYIFLLTKREKYFYDYIAIMEPTSGNAHPRGNGVNPKAKLPAKNSRFRVERTPLYTSGKKIKQNESFSAAVVGLVTHRNRRSVWRIQSRPYRDAHFATFPPKLPEICIMAGTSQAGCCPGCRTPWKRLVKRAFVGDWHSNPELKKAGVNKNKTKAKFAMQHDQEKGRRIMERIEAMRAAGRGHDDPFPQPETVGWQSDCEYYAGEPVPCVVLDPFSGSATTGEVCVQLGRNYIGIETKPEYVEMGNARVSKATKTVEKSNVP